MEFLTNIIIAFNFSLPTNSLTSLVLGEPWFYVLLWVRIRRAGRQLYVAGEAGQGGTGRGVLLRSGTQTKHVEFNWTLIYCWKFKLFIVQNFSFW